MKKKKTKSPLSNFRNDMQLLMLCIPGIVGYLLFQYVPMAGVIIAFKRYTYADGIFGSRWIGLENFELFAVSKKIWEVIRNTVMYNLWFLALGVILNMFFALLLAEIRSRKALKFFQTCMTLPNFMSWVVVGFIAYALMHPTLGVLNQLLSMFGAEPIDVYMEPGYWPAILTFFDSWKGVGMGCLMYYAALMGIDQNLYEAAAIDGANRWQEVRYISIPHLAGVACISSILGVGSLLSADFGLFFHIPRNVSVLLETTDVLSTYLYRGLTNSNYGMSSAVGLTQSVVGLILVLIANLIVKKIKPEHTMM